MAMFVYVGPGERIYPDIVTPNGSLVVKYGDEFEFEIPPTDGLWSPVKPTGKKGEA